MASGVNKGKAKFINYSMDVMIEGRNVARLTDPMTMRRQRPNTMNPAETRGNLGALGGTSDPLQDLLRWRDAGTGGGDFVQKLPPGVEIA